MRLSEQIYHTDRRSAGPIVEVRGENDGQGADLSRCSPGPGSDMAGVKPDEDHHGAAFHHP